MAFARPTQHGGVWPHALDLRLRFGQELAFARRLVRLIDDLHARGQHTVRPRGFLADQIGVHAHHRAGLVLLHKVGGQAMQQLGAALVDLILRPAHVAHYAVAVVIPIDVAGDSLDGVAGALLVIEVRAIAALKDAAAVEHATLPAAFLVVHLHGQHAALALVGPRQGAVLTLRLVLHRVIDGDGRSGDQLAL